MDNAKKLEFVEVEFQPKGVRQGHPGIHNWDKEGLETESMSIENEMHEKPSRLEKTRELLIKTRSGVIPSKLKRVEEVDEKSELDDMDEKSELKGIEIV